MSSADTRGRKQVVCTGIAVLDEVFRVQRFARPDVKTQASAFIAINGGNAANGAYAIGRLGARVSFAGPMGGPAGDDTIGDRLLAMLEKAGIECSACPRVPGMQSSISAIAIEPGGERAIVNYRDDRMNTVKPGDPAAIVAQADAVLADNRFPDFVLPICVAARERGIPVVLDADEPRHDSNRLLDVVSHVVFSAEGLRATAGVEDLAEGLKAVATMTPAWLGVTDGTKGVVWLDSGAVQRRDSFQVKTVDTLGAGDTFHGAFALMLAEGKSEREAIRFSAAAAAVKCTRFGGITGAPTRAEVEEFLKQHD